MCRIARVILSTVLVSIFFVTAVTAEPLYRSQEDYVNKTPSVKQLDRPGGTKFQLIRQQESAVGEPDIVAVWNGATEWMSGVNFAGGETFGNSICKGKYFFGSNVADADYVSVRIIFQTGGANETLCQTFRRDLGYASAGVGTFPGQAYDISDPGNPRRLNICFVEDAGSGAVNLTWDPSGSGLGKREYLYIMQSDYDSSGTTYAGLDGDSDAPSMDILYNWWPLVTNGHTFFENEPCTLTITAYYVNNYSAVLGETVSERVVTLSWGYAGASPVDHFNIYRSTSSPAISLFDQVSSSTFEFVDSSLAFDQEYFYRVEARDASDSTVGNSPEAAIPDRVSENMNFIDHWNGRSLYGDCWGYVDTSNGNEYALLCARDEGVSIIDINVSPPVEVGFMPIMNFGFDSKDVKVYKHYAIVVSEYEDGQIFDISDVTSPVQVSTFTSEGSGGGAHNCIVDGDYLYVVGNHSVGGLEIFDISNPAAPNNVGDFEPFYYHDVDIYNDTLVAAGIYGDGVDLIDVSNKVTPSLIQRFNYTGSGAHNCEFLQGMKYVAVGDEIGDEPHTRIFDLQNLGSINKVSDVLLEVDQPTHNCYFKNDILYIAHYALGLRLINVADPTKPKEVGYYDTYLGNNVGYYGAWNVYPYFPSGKIIVSDMETGLYVLELAESDTCLIQMPGDANGNGVIAIADVVALNAFLNNMGPAPIPLANGDYNGDCIVNQADADELLDSISVNANPVQIVDCTCLEPTVELNCCVGNRGDVNNDGNDANILDLNFLVNYIFRFGPAASCPEEADTNSDGNSGNILDLNYLVNRIFRFGPDPGSC